jgi:cysteinyl-tRNA synthetase
VALRFHNTLSNKLEEFVPIKPGFAGMYHCGPTVYDRVHIGNLRSFILADLVRRTLEFSGFETRQVMNITDIGHLSSDADEGEDKMTRALKREGKEITLENMKKIGDFYTEKFEEDIAKLNILHPHVLPKASEHIEEQIELVKKLEDKGFTYQTSDGIYFDTSKDFDYGELGGLSRKGTQARVAENPEKRNTEDFALWKFNDELGFGSPWGQGFPGWHLECSAMSTKYLGEHFDIHTGGIDLASIHHNNEIAQSESACGCTFVNYWLHNEFVNISGEKMAKSDGNFITLPTLEERGYSPLAYRYFLLLSHYRSKANFSWEGLDAAGNAYEKLKKIASELPEGGREDEAYKAEFRERMENDLNTSQALAVVWTMLKDKEVKPEDKLATLREFDKVLGLGI